MNRDFVEMLRALSDAGVEFLVVGAHAVAAHGFVRATKDIDIWINPTPENVSRVWRALTEFGAPMEQISRDDLVTPGNIYQIGVEPIRIDILTTVAGVDFASAWQNRISFDEQGVTVPCLNKADLLRSKRAAGRPGDLRDIEELERLP
jgi:predicted nucleotidyltransferase